MLIKLTNKETVEILEHIKAMLMKQQSQKFNYALIRNKKILQTKVKEIQKTEREFEKERNELCIKYCKKNTEGDPIIIDKQYEGLSKGTNPEFDKLYEKWVGKVEEFRNNEISIEAYEIKPEFLPDQMVGTQQEAIMPFIVDISDYEKVLEKRKQKEIGVHKGTRI